MTETPPGHHQAVSTQWQPSQTRTPPSRTFPHSDGHIRPLPSDMHATLLSACSTDLRQLRLAAFDLLLANVEPNAGHPVSEQGEHSHEQGEHNRAVLRVPVQPWQQAQQTQQAHGLQ